MYKVNDFCLAMQSENIKREVFTNGPVLGQMQPYTDFLAYKEGSYHKTQESFKFNGYHLVKIVGWSQSIDGSDEWIVENSWGESWGEKGYVKIMGGRGDTQIDFYALGVAVNPYTVYDYYSMQNMATNANFNMDDLDNMEGMDNGDLDYDSSGLEFADEGENRGERINPDELEDIISQMGGEIEYEDEAQE